MTNELDKLKDAWQSVSKSNSSKSFTSDELRKIVKRKSNNEISKIRRKIILEWIVSLLLSVGLVGYVHTVEPSKTLWVAIYISVIVILGLFPYLKIVRFKMRGGGDLKQHLTEYLKAFDLLIKQFVKINTFLIPIAILLACFLGFIIGAEVDNRTYEFRMLDLVLGVIIVSTVTVIGYTVLEKYFYWIYGKNMDRLRKCLDDLSEAEG